MSKRVIGFSPQSCMNPDCKSHSTGKKTNPIRTKGYYYRHSDRSWIRRYRCIVCHANFSNAHLSPCYHQRKRQINNKVRELLCSGVSQRRAATLLCVDRKTIVRKFLFMSRLAKERQGYFLDELKQTKLRVESFQMDEMESFISNKRCPVSIALAVEVKTRKILALDTARFPVKGLLARNAEKSQKNVRDERRKKFISVCKTIRGSISENGSIKTDMHPRYAFWIKKGFPKHKLIHTTTPGKRGCVTGQGELKAVGFDPLFDLNHTAAMIRANVNRMIRKTWCTSKRIDRLFDHLALYADYHNTKLTAPRLV